MSPLSPSVLTAAAVVSSPALWSAFVDQTMPMDVALTRYLVAVLVCWAVIGLVAEFAFPAAGSAKVLDDSPDPEQAPEPEPAEM